MFKKIVLGLFIVLFIVVAALAAIPFIFKDEINAKIKEQINKELLADVEYTSYDLSILKSFPDLFFELNDLVIVGRNDFAGDTLASVKQVGIGLELMKFIRGEELLINSVHFEEPKVIAYSLINENGDTIANYDILPSTEDDIDTSALIDIKVNNLSIRDAKLYYKDFVSGMEFILENLNMDGEVDYVGEDADIMTSFSTSKLSFSDGADEGMQVNVENLEMEAEVAYTVDNADVNTNFKASSFSFKDGSMQYLKDVKLDADIDVAADLVNNVFTLKENSIGLNALKLHAEGMVALPDENTTSMDLKFAADKSSFQELLSLIPAVYLKDYEDVKASGNFALNGLVKGDLTETTTPTFDINLSIENGSIQYPDLPSAIEKINLQARINNNTDNLEKTNVSIPNANFVVVGQAVNMSLVAENVLGDPFVDLKAKAQLPLQKIPEFYPLEGVQTISGDLDADFSFKGLLSSVEKEEYDKIDFTGKMFIDNLVYNDQDLPMPIKAKMMHLDFSPQKAALNAQEVVLGQSDFNINGDVENLINYVLADGVLQGKVAIVSNKINLDELLGEEDTAEEGESTMTKVPKNLDFVASLKANQMAYDGLDLKNVMGALIVRDEKVTLSDLQANLLGGAAKINGSYDTKDKVKPALIFAYDISKFDIQQTFQYLNTMQALAPLAKYMTGTFSTDMSLTSALNNDLSLDLSMLSGLGNVRIPYATFVDLPLFKKISEVTKLPAFDKPALNNAWTVLKFKDGKVDVEPFQIKMQDMVMDIQGSNGFDESINYTMKLTVPSDKFGGAASIANDFLAKQKIPLLNLAVPQNLTFHLNVGGMMKSPTVKIVKVTADSSDKGIKDQIKDNAKEQFNNVKEEVKDQVKEEVDKVKESVQTGWGTVKEEAKDKTKEEAEKVKENIKENIKDKLPGFKW